MGSGASVNGVRPGLGRCGNAVLLAVLLLGLVVGIVLVATPGLSLLVAVAGTAFVAMALARPAWGLAFAVFIGPVFAGLSISTGEGLPDVTFSRVAVACVVVGYLFRRRRDERGNLAVETTMALYSVILLVTSFIRYPRLDFVAVTLHFGDCYLIPFMYFYLAKKLLYRKEQVSLVFWCALLTGLYVAALGSYEFVARTDLMAGSESLEGVGDAADAAGFLRSNGPFSRTETYSILLGMLFFIGFHQLRKCFTALHRSWLAVLVLGAMEAFQLLALSFALVRMTILAVLVGIGSRVLFFRRELRFYMMAGVVFLLLVTMGWSWLQTTNVYRTRLTDVETGYTRLATWKVAMRLVPRYVLVGAGFYGFRRAQEGLRERVDYFGYEPRPTAHNSYLNLLIESGVVGLVAYCALLFMLWRQLIVYARRHASVEAREFAAMGLGVFCMYVVPSLTLTAFGDGILNGVFFTCMGMVAGRLEEAREVYA